MSIGKADEGISRSACCEASKEESREGRSEGGGEAYKLMLEGQTAGDAGRGSEGQPRVASRLAARTNTATAGVIARPEVMEVVEPVEVDGCTVRRATDEDLGNRAMSDQRLQWWIIAEWLP